MEEWATSSLTQWWQSMDLEEKKKKLNSEMPFLCASCWEGFTNKNEFQIHRKTHDNQIDFGIIPEQIFLFLTHDERIVTLNAKHALEWLENRQNFKEYLGMIETADDSILDKKVEEIRAMNLPKLKPREMRRTISGRSIGANVPYSRLSDVI